uniref:Uncharacterized protein n=1 Tax=Solanum tuberosum TaxID=4113 RepID=M1DP00_SOLTU
MPSVDLFRVSGLILEFNLLGIEGTNDPKYLGKELWNIRGFRDEKRRRKIVKNLGKGGGASRQPKPPKRGSEVHPLGRRASQRAPADSLTFEGWLSAPLRAPGTPVLPILPPPFRTSF